ncbi:TPA: hypothetical protein OEH49_003502 [Escherichia coli]|nr:hypothetical protein [Escherichia coli]HCP5471846.1 hypothetical protein [Escherichia coli]HCP5892615.1 hypothetical protein [Escherichia coli]
MNAQDYTDIISLCDKAIDMLDDFFLSKCEMDLRLVKNVAFIFMDERKIRTDVLDSIPVPMRADFSRCVNHINNVCSYTIYPRKNSETEAIYNCISYIKEVINHLIEKINTNKKHITVFYSWQLSTPGKYNNYFIRDCLQAAIKEINQLIPIEERDQNHNIEVDSDTQGTSGSPHIFNTILNKFDTATLFIVDISITSKKTCNSNVMLELGYAIKTLGFNNIIMIFNTALGSLDDLPFDLRSQRVSTYSFKEGDDKKQATKYLTSLLKQAISTALQ